MVELLVRVIRQASETIQLWKSNSLRFEFQAASEGHDVNGRFVIMLIQESGPEIMVYRTMYKMMPNGAHEYLEENLFKHLFDRVSEQAISDIAINGLKNYIERAKKNRASGDPIAMDWIDCIVIGDSIVWDQKELVELHSKLYG